MQEFYHLIRDPVGIHIRPAGNFVRKALQYDSEITLICGGKTANGKRLLSILSLPGTAGQEMCIRVTGKDEKKAARELFAYLRWS